MYLLTAKRMSNGKTYSTGIDIKDDKCLALLNLPNSMQALGKSLSFNV